MRIQSNRPFNVPTNQVTHSGGATAASFCIINLDEELTVNGNLKIDTVEDLECSLQLPYLKPNDRDHKRTQTR